MPTISKITQTSTDEKWKHNPQKCALLHEMNRQLIGSWLVRFTVHCHKLFPEVGAFDFYMSKVKKFEKRFYDRET